MTDKQKHSPQRHELSRVTALRVFLFVVALSLFGRLIWQVWIYLQNR